MFEVDNPPSLRRCRKASGNLLLEIPIYYKQATGQDLYRKLLSNQQNVLNRVSNAPTRGNNSVPLTGNACAATYIDASTSESICL